MSHARIRRSTFAATAVLSLAFSVAPAGAASAPQSRAEFGDRTMDVAARYKGVPYSSGGDTPKEGFDCSGFTSHVYEEMGKDIPRTSQQQYDKADKVGKDPVVGDLVFFHSGDPDSVYHAAIYAGKNKIWHSPSTGGEVSKEKIWTDSWTAGRY